MFRAGPFLGGGDMLDAVLWSREAHTDDVWPLGFPGTRVARSLEERQADATKLLEEHPKFLKEDALALVDTLENTVGEALKAWPTRVLTLVLQEDGTAIVVQDSRPEDIAFTDKVVAEHGEA